MSDSNVGGCLGCAGTILGVIFIWALLFGVTVDGKRYGLSGCDSADGVKIDIGEPVDE
jgi:hypothetical protein